MSTYSITLAREHTHHDETGERTLRAGPHASVSKGFAFSAQADGALSGKPVKNSDPAKAATPAASKIAAKPKARKAPKAKTPAPAPAPASSQTAPPARAPARAKAKAKA